jgi:hypothetical protein
VTTPQAFDGNVRLAVILAATFFPSLVAIIRGVRKNHLGGILVLNAGSIAATIAGDMPATLIGMAIMPLSGLALFVLTAWAFAVRRPPLPRDGSWPACGECQSALLTDHGNFPRCFLAEPARVHLQLRGQAAVFDLASGVGRGNPDPEMSRHDIVPP